ncbi:unnamed protein product [Soboliphyme baturini]|uniref:DM14 domain-containing protein n=1 Tax=Soboliphyme baturini TaxID=241478 RepID=A0A183IQL5_9BILA|nr:unnamed protein product [Soboliphyme baturini]
MAPVYSRETVLNGSPPQVANVPQQETPSKSHETLTAKSTEDVFLQEKAESDSAKLTSQFSRVAAELNEVLDDRKPLSDADGAEEKATFHRSRSVDLEREKRRQERSARKQISARPELGYGYLPVPTLPSASLSANYGLAAPPLNVVGSRSRPVPLSDMSVLPPYPFSSSVTIPQHVLIPPAAGLGRDQQRFQINSEISISYNDRSRSASSQTNYGTNANPVTSVRPLTLSPAPPTSITGSRHRLQTTSSGNESAESKTSQPTAL